MFRLGCSMLTCMLLLKISTKGSHYAENITYEGDSLYFEQRALQLSEIKFDDRMQRCILRLDV